MGIKKTERELIDYDHATILLWGAKQVVPISKIEKRNGVLTPKTHGGLLGSSLCYRKETGQSFLLGKGVNASPLNMNAISYNKWGCRFYSSGEDIIIQTLNPDGSLLRKLKFVCITVGKTVPLTFCYRIHIVQYVIFHL